MSGTPEVEHGGSADAERGRGPRMPWQIIVATLAWLVLGAVLIVSSLTSGGSSGTGDADQGSVDQIQGQLGGSNAAVASQSGHPTLWLLLGLVILVLSGLLFIGQGWARYALGLLGLGAVIAFAVSGRWETFVAFAVLVIGSVTLLAPRAHRYLSGT